MAAKSAHASKRSAGKSLRRSGEASEREKEIGGVGEEADGGGDGGYFRYYKKLYLVIFIFLKRNGPV